MQYRAVLLLLCFLCIGCVDAFIIGSSQIQNCVPPDSQMDINNLVIKTYPGQATVNVDNQFLGPTPISMYGGSKSIFEGPHFIRVVAGTFYWDGNFQICSNKVTIINVDLDLDH